MVTGWKYRREDNADSGILKTTPNAVPKAWREPEIGGQRLPVEYQTY